MAIGMTTAGNSEPCDFALISNIENGPIGFPQDTKRAIMWPENDHAPIRFSLSGLQQGVYPDSPHRGTRKGWPGVSTLRRQESNSSGSGVLRRYLQEELGCRGRQEALGEEEGCCRGTRKVAASICCA